MRNRPSPRFHPLVFFSLFCALVLALASCKDKSTPTAAAAPAFRMNCVILKKAQVQTWVDSGWTNPADPQRIKALLFQFYTPDGNHASENMTLLTYPGSSWSNVRINGRANLTVDTVCVPLKLTGKAILANNVVNLKTLGILKADGTLVDFDFVRFRPVQVDGEYVSFAIEVVKVAGDVETYLNKTDTYPCPPHCPATEPE